MASYRQSYHHNIFGTKNHKQSIPNEYCEELYKYIWRIIKNKNCKLYRINGWKDHIHIFSDLHPSISLADFIKEIKTSTSVWLKSNSNFPDFDGWAEGYGSFTISHNDRNRIINYIKGQKEHHKKESFKDEYKRILKEFGIDFDDKYI
ncbi:MAG: IS200/IS605 family transposase [Bacteroidota bacterium]|nr:IS200/IS605 family transposase [Bacteroidota bacterium]